MGAFLLFASKKTTSRSETQTQLEKGKIRPAINSKTITRILDINPRTPVVLDRNEEQQIYGYIKNLVVRVRTEWLPSDKKVYSISTLSFVNESDKKLYIRKVTCRFRIDDLPVDGFVLGSNLAQVLNPGAEFHFESINLEKWFADNSTFDEVYRDTIEIPRITDQIMVYIKDPLYMTGTLEIELSVGDRSNYTTIQFNNLDVTLAVSDSKEPESKYTIFPITPQYNALNW